MAFYIIILDMLHVVSSKIQKEKNNAISMSLLKMLQDTDAFDTSCHLSRLHLSGHSSIKFHPGSKLHIVITSKQVHRVLQ